jgi:hypothetical protein
MVQYHVARWWGNDVTNEAADNLLSTQSGTAATGNDHPRGEGGAGGAERAIPAGVFEEGSQGTRFVSVTDRRKLAKCLGRRRGRWYVVGVETSALRFSCECLIDDRLQGPEVSQLDDA